MNLTDDEIRQLVSYAQGKFEDERYPFAPALKPVREVLAKVDPPRPEPPRPPKPYVPSLMMQRKKKRR